MSHRFSDLTFTVSVLEQQRKQGTYEQANAVRSRMPDNDRLGEREVLFIQARDSFYMATVNESDWPYIQHRGGDQGFLRVIGDTGLAFVNQAGNGQYQSQGNLQGNDRAALILVDYAQRKRLKILGRAISYSEAELPEIVRKVFTADEITAAETFIVINIEAFDWNCPKYITPRYTENEYENKRGIS